TLDGETLVSVSRDQHLRLWDHQNGKLFLRLAGWDGGLLAVACWPNGPMVATADMDRHVRLWDIRVGQALGQRAGHADFVTAVVFAPDGKLLASGSLDQSVLIWDLKGLVPQAELPGARLTQADLEHLWTQLAGDEEEAEANRALRTLVSWSDQSVPFLR